MERSHSRPPSGVVRVTPTSRGDQQELITQPREKIGQLTVEVDRLKNKCKQWGL